MTKVEVERFNSFQDAFLKDFSDKLNLDGGVLTSLWLYYFELENESECLVDPLFEEIFKSD